MDSVCTFAGCLSLCPGPLRSKLDTLCAGEERRKVVAMKLRGKGSRGNDKEESEGK